MRANSALNAQARDGIYLSEAVKLACDAIRPRAAYDRPRACVEDSQGIPLPSLLFKGLVVRKTDEDVVGD